MSRLEVVTGAVRGIGEGRPEEVAAFVSFLLSDDAGQITGATLDFNGGVLMR